MSLGLVSKQRLSFGCIVLRAVQNSVVVFVCVWVGSVKETLPPSFEILFNPDGRKET